MAKRAVPLCKKCGRHHWMVVACEKAAASAPPAAPVVEEREVERPSARRVPQQVILRHPRAGMSDQLHSVVRMGERTLARPRERGQAIGSIREV